MLYTDNLTEMINMFEKHPLYWLSDITIEVNSVANTLSPNLHEDCQIAASFLIVIVIV